MIEYDGEALVAHLGLIVGRRWYAFWRAPDPETSAGDGRSSWVAAWWHSMFRSGMSGVFALIEAYSNWTVLAVVAVKLCLVRELAFITGRGTYARAK